MISISCEDLSLSFGTDVVFENVGFALNDGEKLGIVGVNGAGKTSLLKIISGEYSADKGKVYVSKDYKIGMLEQHPDFVGGMTVYDVALVSFSGLISAENELEVLNRRVSDGDFNAASEYNEKYERFSAAGGLTFRSKCRGMLQRFGFGEDMLTRNVCELSGGQKTRLALVSLLLSEPDIMLLDEPTNHLDTDTLFWLENFLSGYNKTVITVSHDRYFLDKTCTNILELENGHAAMYNGNYSSYVSQKKVNREIAERHYKNQQKEIARIEAYIEQQRRWNRERNIIAAESREKQLAKMKRVDRPEALPDRVKFLFKDGTESGNDVLELRNLSKGFGSLTLFSNASFLIKKHERVFIDGHNGCGKSTLLKILAGRLIPDEGMVEYGYNVKIGYYDQENQNLDMFGTVLDELWNTYPDKTQTEIRNSLAMFLFKGDDVLKQVSVLSGGEKARLTLVKLMLSESNLLILDEPTNHLDIASREALEEALSAYDGTVVCVSHDRYFTEKLATRMITFDTASSKKIGATGVNEGCKSSQLFDFRGGYDEFVKYREEYLSTTKINENSATVGYSNGKEEYLNAKRNQAEKRKEANRLKKAKEECGRIEAEIGEIDKRLAGEEATQYTVVAELCSKRDELEERLLELYEFLCEFEQDF